MSKKEERLKIGDRIRIAPSTYDGQFYVCDPWPPTVACVNDVYYEVEVKEIIKPKITYLNQDNLDEDQP